MNIGEKRNKEKNRPNEKKKFTIKVYYFSFLI